MNNQEPLLKNNTNKFVLFPIEHEDIFEMYKTQMQLFWTAEELDIEADLNDWNNKLSDNERHFIKYVLAFFAASDGIVSQNLAERFYNEVEYTEAKFFYGFQLMMENIHSEVYSLLIDTYIKDTEEKNHLFNAIQTVPAVMKKAEWAVKWINSTDSFAERLVAFCAVEGIFFSGSFCAIFWLKKKGLMVNGLGTSNEFISRDEGFHCEFAAHLYKNHLVNKLPQSKVYEIITNAVEIEKEFIIEALPVSLIGMNSDLMSQYIEFVADRWLLILGYEKYYNATNPFEFMDNMNLQTKSNFFEKKVSDYRKASIGNSVSDFKFELDNDF